MKAGTRLVIISISAITSSGTGSPSCGGDAVGPGARGVDDDGRLEIAGAGGDAPHAAVARQPGHAHALDHASAPSAMALRRKAWVVRKGSAAPSRRETTPPGQSSDTAGTRRFSSARSISSSCV